MVLRFAFVHAADLHLDTPFTGLAAVNQEVAEALRDASLTAFAALVDRALAEEAAFLLLAGDTYDGVRRGLRAERAFRRGVERLVAAGVQVFLVHGNHDPLRGWPGGPPPGVVVFGAERAEAHAVHRAGRRLATVYGVSFAEASERRNLARLIRRQEAPGLHIGLLHANVGGQAEHDDYAPCSLADLMAAGLDYWALGHVHRHLTLLQGRPWAAYAGTLQGRSPAPGERGAKGALVVLADDEEGILGPPRFVPLDRVRFLQEELELPVVRDPLALVEAAAGALARLRSDPSHEGRGLVVRLVLSGATEDGGGLEPGAEDEVLAAVREETAGFSPFVWCEGLQLRLRPHQRAEELLARPDLVGEVARQAVALRGEPEALGSLLASLGERLPPAFRRFTPDETQHETLLRAAEELCLALLLEREAPL